MIEEIKSKAKELLKAGKVDLVVGYKRAPDGVSAMPAFINKEENVEDLVWDSHCMYDLPNYLKDFRGKKIAMVAKACDVRSIIVLLQENQLTRDDVFIIGVECSGVIDEKKLCFGEDKVEEVDFDKRCKVCAPAVPSMYDVLISQKDKEGKLERETEDTYEAVLKFEAKTVQERFKFWREEFSRCIRCYACRQICPSCYCPKCVAEQASPAWFSKATTLEGNFAWNVNRAMHLAGRCVDCGECERACPVGIPLRDINRKIEKDIKELFDFEAAASPEQKHLFSSFDENDPEDFIK